MGSRFRNLQLSMVLLLGVVLLASSGCSTTYLKHRREDALDMVDVGVTLSTTPQLAIYKACAPLFTIGYGDLEADFMGLGGGKFGRMRHFHEGLGLALWGRQKIAFGEYDREDPETFDYDGSGPLGMVSGPFPGPDYMLCCVQHLHLGWVGVVFNARWLQMIDFALGWTTLDICYDDGVERATWGGKSLVGSALPEDEEEEEAVEPPAKAK